MKKALIILALLYLLPFALPISAQTARDYTLLAPIPLSGLEGGDTKTTTPGPYIKGIFILAIAVAGGLAVIKIMFGGIKYLTSEAFEGKGDAKETIQNAIWGLLLAISAWLILYTINPKLVEFDLSIPIQSSSASVETTGGGGIGGTATGKGGDALSQKAALDQFTGASITVEGAITLEGLRQGVVDEVVRLNGECLSADASCKVVVTSATGGAHDTTVQPVCNHKNGYKVDLRSNGQGTTLTNYIKNNYTKFPNRGNDGAEMYKSPSGIFYAYEGDHWDVTVC